jgi:SAM-dependent methyltransferase
MIKWLTSREAFEHATADLEPRRAAAEGYFMGVDELTGYCSTCDAMQAFTVLRPADGSWCNLRESVVCPSCGLNGRSRMAMSALREVFGDSTRRALLFERMTPFFRRAYAEFPFVVGCEYLDPAMQPGTTKSFGHTLVRHEDMLALSFGDATLDVVFHGDVLEHVPDHRRGLRECHRVLCRGGRLLFTVPFFDLEEHIVRAEVVDGELVHHLDPQYHGNPISADGSLVFAHHGWPLFQDLRDAGFETVEIGLLYDPFGGILSCNSPTPQWRVWPMLFRATK